MDENAPMTESTITFLISEVFMIRIIPDCVKAAVLKSIRTYGDHEMDCWDERDVMDNVQSQLDVAIEKVAKRIKRGGVVNGDYRERIKDLKKVAFGAYSLGTAYDVRRFYYASLASYLRDWMDGKENNDGINNCWRALKDWGVMSGNEAAAYLAAHKLDYELDDNEEAWDVWAYDYVMGNGERLGID